MIMKKIYIIIAAALAMVACTKNDISAPVASLTASTEAGTKTALDGMSVVWNAGDAINVFSKDGIKKFATADGGATAVFKGEGVAIDETTLALYPYDAEATAVGGIISTTFSSTEQKVVSGNFAQERNIAAAKCGADKKASFKNAGAYLKFTLTQEGADTIRRIEIKANGGEKIAVNGKVSIDLNGEPVIAADASAETSDVITLTPEADAFANATYYVWVMPGTYADGITVTLVTPTQMTATKVGTSSLDAGRNKIVDLGEIGGLAYKAKEAEIKTLTFDFSGTAQEGWPTKDKWNKVETAPLEDTYCTYTMEDSSTYTFVLTQCLAAVDARIAWSATGLTLYASQRFVGLPALEGYKLIGVKCIQGTAPKTTRKGAITSKITESTEDPYCFVSGGESQVWNVEEISYYLEGTEVNTVYYLACTAGGIGSKSIELKYEKVD